MKKQIVSALALAMALGTAVPAMAAEQAYDTKEEAKAAAEQLIKESDVNNGYDIGENDGKFYIQLKTDGTKTETETPKENEDAPKAKEDSKPVEDDFNPDVGFKTEADAIKAAEYLVAKSEINKGYNVTQGEDGLFYIQLTPQANKTKDLERKPIANQGKQAANNAKTGIAGVAGVAGILAAASVAYTTSKRD